MSAIPQGFASWGTPLYPQFGNGIYLGNNPGSSNPTRAGKPYGGADNITVNSGLTIQTDANVPGAYISTMSDQPENVMRLTTSFGDSFIQGKTIGFALPFSGTAGVTILPSTGTLSATGVIESQSFVSLNAPNGTGGQALMNQNYSVTINNTSTITSANLAFEPINGGLNGVSLRLNFYDANGVLRYVRDL